MTDRSNDAPGETDPEGMTPEEVVEEAPDLTDAQLDAASNAAESQVEFAEAEGETLAEADEDDAELEGGDDGGETEVVTAAPVRLGARQRAAQAAAAKAAAAERGARAPKTETRTTFPIDPALRIKDRASAAFVLASILFFVLIFVNAMAFGRGGAFTVVPTSTPFVSPSPAPSVSPGPSGSAATPGSPGASPAGSSAASAGTSSAPSAGPSGATPSQ